MGKWKKLRVNAIKESFDQLPTAVCFFDNLGGIVLCNRQMYRLSQYLFQSDMQYLGEVKIALASPPDGVVRLSDMEDTYRFPDKTVWQFEWTKVTDRYGEVYTQLTAADITELHRALVQLADDNRKLEEDAKKLRELSENVEAVAREKELLAAKSAMHDSLAACITVTKQYLAGDLGEVDAGMVLQEWGKSIAFREADLLSAKEKLFHDAKSSGVMVRMKGEEPKGSAADLMYVAMQVCLNNARFGDPEAQVVFLRMKNDIIDVVEACIDGTLDQIDLQFEDNAAVCVVLASEGYPVKYDKGLPISGLDEFKKHEGYYCFHAGTKFDGDQIVTNGGRVLGVTAKGKDLKEARANAYAATEWVQFDNKYMRHDIGKAIDEA